MATLKAATDGSAPSNTEGFFSQFANEVLDSAEKISNRLEEGLNAILTGDISAESKEPQGERPSMGGEADEDFGDEEEFDWSQVDMDSESPLSGIAESVVGDIMQGQSGPQTMLEHLDAFRHAINWTEPLILGILSFQAIIFLCTLWVSRPNVSLVPRIILMVVMAGLVRSAETINSWAGRNWQGMSSQNYFDRGGIFISIFLCAPLLLDSFIMLICFLREASQLLVQVKTAELKQKRKKKPHNNTQQVGTKNGVNGPSTTSDQGNKRRGKKDQ